jgi:hypothetical protein
MEKTQKCEANIIMVDVHDSVYSKRALSINFLRALFMRDDVNIFIHRSLLLHNKQYLSLTVVLVVFYSIYAN